MDLWIRSQDKHQLIKADSIGLTYDDGKASRIVCYENSRTWVVARYRTEERAMEVLDEIQNFLMPSEPIFDLEEEGVNYWNNLYAVPSKIETTSDEPINTIVYEMPTN